MSAHAAAAVIARVRRLPWIAEMQDPIVYQGFGRSYLSRWVARLVERVVHERATGVVYVTEAAAGRARRRTGGRARCAVIRPGAEPSGVAGRLKRTDCMEIIHVGTLAGKRNPGTLLEALGRLAARRPSVRREVRVSLVGTLCQRCRRMVREFPHPEMVRASGKVSREAALEEAGRADLLVVIQHQGSVSEETLPSKTYDYLVSGRSVLGLAYRNEELARILRDAGHECAEVDDVAGIEGALERAYERWREGRLEAEPCLRYTVEGAARELVAWSRRIRGMETGQERAAQVWMVGAGAGEDRALSMGTGQATGEAEEAGRAVTRRE